MQREQQRFWALVAKSDGCWLWTGGRDRHGYGKFAVGLKRDRTQKTQLAHRVAWMYTHGAMPQLNLLHQCDNPQCVRPDHMFVGTQKDNLLDAAQKGRTARGERNGVAKLTAAAVAAIKARRANGEKQQAIAEAYGINRSLVSMIEHGKRWGHAHV